MKKTILVISGIVLLSFVFLNFAFAQTTAIPQWVKAIAGWWSEGKVSDNEFVGAMQFLINSNIIKISSNSTANATQLQQIDQLHQQIYTLQSQLNSANSQIATLQQQLTLQSTSQTSQNPITQSQTPNIDPQKALAKSWSQGQISDAQFIQAIQNLINNGTIPPFNGTSAGEGSTQQIPAWIKNNAGWWADGQVDDATYRAGLTYLFNQGILHNPTTNSQNNITPQNTANTYVNNVYKFSMQQPSGWTMQEGVSTQIGSAIVVFLAPIQQGQFDANIGIKSVDMQGFSFNDVINATKTSLANQFASNDFIMLNEGSLTINGKSAYFLQYAVNLGVPIEVKQVLIANNNNEYIITCTSSQNNYNTYSSQFENSISTFQLQ